MHPLSSGKSIIWKRYQWHMTPDFLQAPVIQMPFGKESKAAKKKVGGRHSDFCKEHTSWHHQNSMGLCSCQGCVSPDSDLRCLPTPCSSGWRQSITSGIRCCLANVADRFLAELCLCLSPCLCDVLCFITCISGNFSHSFALFLITHNQIWQL